MPVHGQCTLACNGQVNLGLDADCQEEITPALILQSYSGCMPETFLVTVYQPNGISPIPTSPVVTAQQIGLLLPVKVQHIASGNFCWGSVLVSDNLPPNLVCPPDITVSCTESLDPFDIGPPQISDCQAYTLTYFDQFTDLNCGDPTAYYTRTWNAADVSGNFTSCQQIISISAPDLSQIVFPPNLNGMEAPALACPNPGTDPANTGVPLLDNGPIPEGGSCDLFVFYSDLEVPACEGASAILRNWSVLEWCSGNIEQKTQVILIQDIVGPTVQLLDTLVVSTDNQLACTATVNLPAAVISDNCADTLSVQILTPFGSINTNGGQFLEVPFGNYEITYQVSDPCGNITEAFLFLEVIDLLPPVAICDQITAVSLGPFGTTMVFAETFDDGSFDNCCPITRAARRTDGMCNQGTDFANSVTFCCTDIGQVVNVEFRVMDCFGNANYCDVLVFVSDQIDPEIVCPATVTISCAANPLDLELTGEPFVFDGCGIDSVYFQDTEDLNDCQIGSISRTWTVLDNLGNTASCNQEIILEDQTPLIIQFPPDLDLFGCHLLADLDPEDLDPPYDSPMITNDDCELVATNFSDEVFTVTPDACLKIIRTWTLIDWCVYEPNSGSTVGMYVGIQTIKVIDDEAPLITCPPNQLVEITDNTCQSTLSLPDPTVDDCDFNYEISIISDFGNGNGPFANVSPGIYAANYFVTDGCNNTSSCTTQVEVVDAKAPSPYCLAGANAVLMPIDTTGNGQPDLGMIELAIQMFDLGSTDNCDPQPLLSFSSNPVDTLATFDCSNLGLNVIQLWVTDASGNQDYCETYVVIQDNSGACNGGTQPLLGGLVLDELGQGVSQVAVFLNDSAATMEITDPDGIYTFENVVQGLDYSITPEKDLDVRNGVTTWDLAYIQKHILGIEALDSPYKIIAADADRSGVITTVDIVALQQLILFLQDELPGNNTSWRFVDASYDFLNPTNPLQEDFPEVVNINNLVGENLGVDFMAIKVGDVNNSANPNNANGVDQREAPFSFQLSGLDLKLEAGETYSWDLYAQQAIELLGTQGSLHFDPTKVEILQVESPALTTWTKANKAFPSALPGIMTWSWCTGDPVSLVAEEVVFRFLLRAKQTTQISAVVGLSQILLPEVYSENGHRYRLDWHLMQPSENIGLVVRPTVFNQQTEICWPDEARLDMLEIRDVRGTLIYILPTSTDLPACLILKWSDFPASGIYFVHARLSGKDYVKRIILMD